MIDITVIVPIIPFDEDKKFLFERAIDSIPEGAKILVVGSKEAFDTVNVKKSQKLVNDEDTCYAAQVNFAVKSVKTKYFTVLEYDDIFSKKWFENVEKYEASMDEDIFAFYPLTEMTDYNTNETVGYSNEAFLATSFSNELGYMDLDALEGYMNINNSGAVFKTEQFISLGALKSSMKLVFWYEFIMRALYKQKRIYVIPKVGYIHYINREDSMTNVYASTMDSKEADWWIDLAKKEYFFPQDRKKTYEE